MSRDDREDLTALGAEGRAGGSLYGTTTPEGRHPPGAAVAQAGSGRSPLESDYRLRGLHTDPGFAPTAPTRPERQRRRPRRLAPLVTKTGVVLAVAALAAWLLQAFVVQPFAVPGRAMAPTLRPHDRILVDKSGVFEGTIHPGQIVVLRAPKLSPCYVEGHSGDLVLRVIATPGQRIWSIGGTVFVDGRPLRERGWYDRRYGQLGSRAIPSTTLGADHYFVMGDNRSSACDSRVFGPVPKKAIVGVAVAIVGRNGHVFIRGL